jgi:hypothetical protein
MATAPDPMQLHPIPGQERVVFLKPLVTDPKIEVGDYTYYDDPDDPPAFQRELGYSALVMPGVNIGHGAVVAAGSLVASDVAPYAILAGNPARVGRRRYDDEDVTRLLRAAWWDWPVEVVAEHARTIMSGEPADLERIADDARAE